MRRAFLPLAILMALSMAAAGTNIGAEDETRGTSTAKTGKSDLRPALRDGSARPSADGDLNIKTIKVSGDRAGNWRNPGVAENAQGDRLIIFRGPNNLIWYTYQPKDGSWTTPKVIPNQPVFEKYRCTDVEADSDGRFHCIWEEPDVAVAYGCFQDGTWSNLRKLGLPGKHDMGVAVAVRSNNQVILTNACVVRSPVLTKDVYFYYKNENENNFHYQNMINDPPSSNQPAIAVDQNDHIWLAHKAEPELKSEDLVIRMAHYGKDNNKVGGKMVTDVEGWRFWPQIAVNTADKVMIGWSHTQNKSYEFRVLDRATGDWTEVHAAGPGIPTHPWAQFWSKMVSHDEDFYWVVMDPSRVLHLLKYNGDSERFDDIAEVSNAAVDYYDVYAGYDKLLVAWGSQSEPTSVYLTTVDIAPYSRVRIFSVANLEVEKRVERGFFHGYYLNALTWEANPQNTEAEIVVASQRVYRKGAAEADSAWTMIAELGASDLSYEDRNIPQDSDYVYAVTCVDADGMESVIGNE